MFGQCPGLFGVVDGFCELPAEGVDFDGEPEVVVELEVAAFAIAVPPAAKTPASARVASATWTRLMSFTSFPVAVG